VRPISTRFRAALGRGHERVTEITCAVPGGEAVPIGPSQPLGNGQRTPGWSAGSVSSSKSSGVRYSANLTLIAAPASDTFGMISTPGAIFKIRHGIRFGPDDTELVDLGVYEAVKAATTIGEGTISLPLVDQWQRVERCRFLSPHYPETGYRAVRIADAVSAAIPSVTTRVYDMGGVYEQGDNVWDRDRTKFITDMATDGALDAAFDVAGEFRVRALPILDPKASVWTFATGPAANIISADRERPFDRNYNIVIVEPMDDTQSWDRQIVVLPDVNHPRHPSKIGDVPVWYKSPTIENEEQAAAAGVAIMQRVLGATETVSLNAHANPALEVDDVVTIAHEGSDTDPKFAAIHMIDSLQIGLTPNSLSMSLATRSADLADLELS
jgi:hypothetical protein